MAPIALYAGHDRLQIAGDGGGVAADASLKIASAFLQAERCLGIRGSSAVLTHSDAVLMELWEIADAGFAHGVGCAHERRLTLRTGSEHPLDQTGGLIRTARGSYGNAIGRGLISKRVAIIGFAQRLLGQVLHKGARERGRHGVGHASLGVELSFRGMAGGAIRCLRA